MVIPVSEAEFGRRIGLKSNITRVLCYIYLVFTI